jgi:cyclophilin family peptidyl-prolyl cis-trans isomerase
MVLASPSKAASVKLEFTERSYHHHEAWTIGLTKSHNGGYNLYVNLQDNSHVHEGDVCLGKITGGFDTLQKLMHQNTVAKTPGGEKAYLDPPVPIERILNYDCTKTTTILTLKTVMVTVDLTRFI